MSSRLEALRAASKTFVPARGSSIADLIIVGEQPGQHEVMERTPFVGPAGKLLKACLQHAQIPLAACYLTNVFKDFDAPLEDCLTSPKTRQHSPIIHGKGNEYIAALREEISEHPAKVILAVGNVALWALTGRWGIHKWRGSILPLLWDSSRWVIPIVHPSSVLRGASEDRHLICADLAKLVKFRETYKLTERNLITGPTFTEACNFLDACYWQGLDGTTVSFDIETKYNELNCIGFSTHHTEAMCIPFLFEKGDYFTIQQEAEIMKKVSQILQNSLIRKVGQNLIYDSHFLLRRYGIRTVNMDDTMIAMHSLMPQFPKGLDMITSLFTDLPYYKDEGKEWFSKGGAYKTLWEYNCLDAIVCAEAFPKLLSEIIQLGNLSAYERQLAMISPCAYMMEHGIVTDLPNLKAERSVLESEAMNFRAKLKGIAPNLNPQSPKQLQDYFYNTLRIQPYKNKQGKPTADADALKRIARRKGEKGSEEARLILNIRKNEKLASTYMADLKFDADSRIRCFYNPCGTTYSRLSSSKSLFGSGMNMQNWPHRMLKFLKPDPGFVYYGVDLSQAENRIVAYVGRIEQMIEAFETGKDVHRLTAALIFNKSPEEISDEPGSCSLGTGEFSERDWGKKANHGLNYDFGYKQFAQKYEMPEAEGKRIYTSYHSAYPGVKRDFHGYVKTCLRKDRVVQNLMGRRTLFLTDLDDQTFKAAYACIPQGTVGDVINERGMLFLYHTCPIAEILQQVHDNIGFQISLDYPWEDHAKILWDLKASLETPLETHYGRKFVIPADIVMGLSLMKEEGLEIKAKKFPDSITTLAETLEANYKKLTEVV